MRVSLDFLCQTLTSLISVTVSLTLVAWIY